MKKGTILIRFVLLLILFSLVLVACGGDEPEDEEPAPTEEIAEPVEEEAAEPVLREILASERRRLGNQHPLVANLVLALGIMLWKWTTLVRNTVRRGKRTRP